MNERPHVATGGESRPCSPEHGHPRVKDRLGRPLRDLRISVTDRCNFRCVYCMPKAVFGAHYPYLDRRQVLSYEEIQRVARIAAAHGVTKLRLTGGEPLVRHEVERLIQLLADIPAIEELTLTTNGSLLTRQRAQVLKEAGLRRVTISLDALDDTTFKAMNDVNFPVGKVLAAIDNAAAAGLAPVKINMVVKRGVNDHAVLPMARYFRASGHIVRFIEFMDVGNSNGWRLDDVVTAEEIAAIIDAEFPIEPIAASYRGEVAQRWRYRDGGGEIGIISSVSQPFCATCTRARLSAEGTLYTCLFATRGYDLRRLLREGASDEYISEVLASVWSHRADRYSEIRSLATAKPHKIEMSYIGG